jgi:hypothetical protein
MGDVMQVSLGSVSVMGRSFVVTGFVVPGCLAVMSRRVLVVLGRAEMVFCRLFRHASCLRFASGLAAGRLRPP